MKSPVVKRSIVLAGHKTSVSLEEAFWKGLKDIAMRRHQTLSDLVGSIDGERKHGNLSSAIRLFVLNHYQARSSSEHIVKSGHKASWEATVKPIERASQLLPKPRGAYSIDSDRSGKIGLSSISRAGISRRRNSLNPIGFNGGMHSADFSPVPPSGDDAKRIVPKICWRL
jgi:predicted DNA-binding ribbon-helix-helix protein